MQHRAFTLIELVVVVALIGVLAGIVLTILTDARFDARDKRRVSDLEQIKKALELYHVDHNTYPKESEGANGNISTNNTFKSIMQPYLSGTLVDPAGIGDSTFYYYYDGSATCGNRTYAIIFARQMDRSQNSNYDEFLNTTCGGVLDGEGRGGGVESYNVRLDEAAP